MNRNFQDVMARRNELLHQLAVWQEVVDHLGKFLDTDAFSATVGIRTEGGDMVVPQDRVEAVLSEVNYGYIAEINDELEKINKSEVAENVKQEKRLRKKKEPEKKKTKRKDSKTVPTRSKPNKRKVGARKQLS